MFHRCSASARFKPSAQRPPCHNAIRSLRFSIRCLGAARRRGAGEPPRRQVSGSQPGVNSEGPPQRRMAQGESLMGSDREIPIARHQWPSNQLLLQGSTLLFSSIKAAVECTLLVLCVSSFADQHSSLVVRLASDQHSKIEP